MPALNRGVNTRSENDNNNRNRSVVDTIMNNVSFTGAMTVIMGVLSIKERWDASKDRREEREFRRALLERQTQNPGAAANGLNPPPYRDNPSSEDLVRLENASHSPPTPLTSEDLDEVDFRPRKRRTNCCVCCGIRCDIVFKALGIVLVLYLGYGIFKLVRWATTPSPTGLENMPEYSKSLGCLHAPFTYPTETFDGGIPTWISLHLTGAAVGTVLLTQSDTRSAEISMILGTNEQPLLDKVSASMDLDSDAHSSKFRLSTPSAAASEDACMRFDIIVHVPSGLSTLSIKSQSVVQIKYDENAPISATEIIIDMASTQPDNLLLPSDQVSVNRTNLMMRAGYLVGSLSFGDKAEITAHGTATTNLQVTPLPASADAPAAGLGTSAGSGRTDIIYKNPNRRMISSTHISSGGDLYLTYKDAGYNGSVQVAATSWRSSGIQGGFGPRPSNPNAEWPWVGDKDGPDHLVVKTSGWAGTFF